MPSTDLQRHLAERGLEQRLVDLDHSAPAAEPHAFQLPDPRYIVGPEVARGGMGAILSVHDRNIHREVAVKVMHADTAADRENVIRFIEEAQVTSQLEHPNIVPVHEVGITSEQDVYYTMKMVRGHNLEQILADIRKNKVATIRQYPLSRLLTIFQKACDGIAFAHSRGVLHRDLKPENIMVGKYGEVLIMDWGLAKVIGAPERPATGTSTSSAPDWLVEDVDSVRSSTAFRTMAGEIMGTPGFMAPEQAAGAVAEFDPRTDIYALGAILYYILCLHTPVEGTVEEVLEKTKAGDITPALSHNPPDDLDPAKRKWVLPHLPNNRIPPPLAAVATKALARDRDRRYQTVPELQRDLEAYQQGFATGAEEAGALRLLYLLVQRHRLPLAIIAGTLTVLALVILSFIRQVQQEKHRAQTEEAKTRLWVERFEAEKATQAELGMLSTDEHAASALDMAREGNYDKALATVDDILDLDARSAAAWALRGQLKLGEIQLEDAANAFTAVGELEPNGLGRQTRPLLEIIGKYRRTATAGILSHEQELDLQRDLIALPETPDVPHRKIVLPKLSRHLGARNIWFSPVRSAADCTAYAKDPARVTWNDGTVELDNTRLALPIHARDVIVRAHVRVLEGKNVLIKLRQAGRDSHQAWFSGTSFGLGEARNGEWAALATPARFKQPKQGSVLMQFAAIGDRLILCANGRELRRIRVDRALEGTIELGTWEATGTFRNIAVRPLPADADGVPDFASLLTFEHSFTGWRATDDARVSVDEAGSLSVSATGSAPAIGLEGLAVPGDAIAAIHVQARIPNGRGLVLHWITEADQEWDHAKRIALPVPEANAPAQAFVFPVHRQESWTGGTVAAIRLEVTGARDGRKAAIVHRIVAVSQAPQQDPPDPAE